MGVILPKRQFTVIIEKDDTGYFVADVPELPGCHTQAKSLNALMRRIKEAIQLYLEEQKDIAPTSEFVGIQTIEVEA